MHHLASLKKTVDVPGVFTASMEKQYIATIVNDTPGCNQPTPLVFSDGELNGSQNNFIMTVKAPPHGKRRDAVPGEPATMEEPVDIIFDPLPLAPTGNLLGRLLGSLFGSLTASVTPGTSSTSATDISGINLIPGTNPGVGSATAPVQIIGENPPLHPSGGSSSSCPPVFHSNLASACVNDTPHVDLHFRNTGCPANGATISAQISPAGAYDGQFQDPQVSNYGGNATGFGTVSAQDSNGVTNVSATTTAPINKGDEFAMWPYVNPDPTATITASITGGPTVSATISDICPTVGSDPPPGDPVCSNTDVLFVFAVGNPQAKYATTFTADLGDCYAPSTVNSLVPTSCTVEGSKIVCTDILLGDLHSQMVSFSVLPRESCAGKTDATMSGVAEFGDQPGVVNATYPKEITSKNTHPVCECAEDDPYSVDPTTCPKSPPPPTPTPPTSPPGSSSSSARSGSSSSAGASSSRSGSSSLSSSARASSSSASASSSRSSSSASSRASSASSSAGNNGNDGGDNGNNGNLFSSSVNPQILIAERYGSLADPSLVLCGNAVLDGHEQCDDGNRIAGDGCSVICLREYGGRSGNNGNPYTGDVSDGNNGNGGYKVPPAAGTPTGPGAVIFLVSGAAAGVGIVRRRMRRN